MTVSMKYHELAHMGYITRQDIPPYDSRHPRDCGSEAIRDSPGCSVDLYAHGS